MEPAPYRTSSRGDAPSQEVEPPALGALRSTHSSPTLARKVVPAGFVGAIMLLSAAVGARGDLLTLAVATPVVAVTIAAMTLWSLRGGRYAIALHEHGLAVVRGERREEIEYARVDEVWFELRMLRFHFASVALIRAIRLVEHDGTAHRVPMPPDPVVGQTLVRRCSESLLAEARRAVAAGESLQFAGVRLSRAGVTVDGVTRDWDGIPLVRFQPGRIVFFARSRLMSWKTVRLDRIPHPTVFQKLVRENARKIDVDDDLASDE